MSLFLIYLEVGAPKPRSVPSQPLFARSLLVINTDRRGKPRDGIAITDGISADYFTQYGNRAVARKGDDLRKAFSIFVKSRLAIGASPHFALVDFEGGVSEVHLSLDHARPVQFDDLENAFRHIQLSEVIRIGD